LFQCTFFESDLHSNGHKAYKLFWVDIKI